MKTNATIISKELRRAICSVCIVLIVVAIAAGCGLSSAGAGGNKIKTRDLTQESKMLIDLSGMQMNYYDYELADDVKYLSVYIEFWTQEGLLESDLRMYDEVGDANLPAEGTFGVAYNINSGEDHFESISWRMKLENTMIDFETELPQITDGSYTGYSNGSLTDAYEIPTDSDAIIQYLCFDTGNGVNAYPTEYLNENRSYLAEQDAVTVTIKLVPTTTSPLENNINSR